MAIKHETMGWILMVNMLTLADISLTRYLGLFFRHSKHKASAALSSVRWEYVAVANF